MIEILLIKLALIFFALLPGGLLAGFFITYFRRRLGSELAAIALGLGVIAAYLVLALHWLGHFLPPLIPPASSVLMAAFNDALFSAAIPEEAAKFLLLMAIVRRHEDCDSGGDLFCSAVLIGLGFAAIENVLYLIESGPHWLGLGLLRGALAVPGHAIFGIMMGHFAAEALRVGTQRVGTQRAGGQQVGAQQPEVPRGRYKWVVLALSLPIAAHALYDFPLMASEAIARDPNGALVYLGDRLTYLALGVLAAAGVIAWLIARRELVKIYTQQSDHDLAVPPARALLPWRLLGWVMMIGAVGCLAFAGWIQAHDRETALFLMLPSIFPLTFGSIMQMRPPGSVGVAPAAGT